MEKRTPLRVVGDQVEPAAGRAGRRVDVVGEAQYQDVLAQLAGGKQPESQYITTNAELWREPDNPHDPNAVQVRIAGSLVGYLPRAEAERLAARMDAAGEVAMACPAEIRGGWRDRVSEGSFGVIVWLPRARMR